MLTFLLSIDDCIDSINADILDKEELKFVEKEGFGNLELGLVQFNGRVGDFIEAIAPFEVYGTTIEHALSCLLAEAYKLGFNQGSKGLPPHVEVDPMTQPDFSMDTLLNTDKYHQY